MDAGEKIVTARLARGAAGRGRLSMFALLIFRSLSVHGSRLGAALGAIVIGAAVVSALTSLYLDIPLKMSQELRAFGANVIVALKDKGADAGAQRGVPTSLLRSAMAVLPGQRLVGGTPYLYGVVRLAAGDAILVGVDFPGLRAISPYWRVSGEWVSTDFDTRNIMMGRHLAQVMGYKLGDSVKIADLSRSRSVQATLKGLVETGGTEEDEVFVNLPVAQGLLGREGEADLAMLSVVAQGSEANAMTAEIDRRFPLLEARPIRELSQSDGQVLDKIEGLMALVSVIILGITILCVNATLTAMVAARTSQIALQKALGAASRAIAIQFLVETTIACLIGVAIGLGIGFVLAQLLGQAVFGAWVTFHVVVLPVTLCASLLAALVAAILPVRRAVRIAPAQILKGE